eukprot:SAG11_NODE_11493_length_757_cov_0.800912_1_plen_86_part_10
MIVALEEADDADGAARVRFSAGWVRRQTRTQVRVLVGLQHETAKGPKCIVVKLRTMAMRTQSRTPLRFAMVYPCCSQSGAPLNSSR